MQEDKHPTFGHGKVCYLEIPAVDVSKSASFYAEVFGWRVRRSREGNVSFDDGVGEVSGMWTLSREPITDTGVLTHIMVNDIQKTIEAILARGGKITRPVGLDAPEVTARFSDPAGNIFGLYQHGGNGN